MSLTVVDENHTLDVPPTGALTFSYLTHGWLLEPFAGDYNCWAVVRNLSLPSLSWFPNQEEKVQTKTCSKTHAAYGLCPVRKLRSSDAVKFYSESRLKFKTATPMFTVALSKIAKTWRQPKCPSTRERISKIWHVHAMDYDLAVKREEIWTQAATWMDLEDLMLSEMSQSQKDKY